MNDSQALTLVRLIHTIIYLVMVCAIAVLLYGGITGYNGLYLWIALGLIGVETLVFFGNGMKCPLTALAVHYGADKGYAFDTFLPESVTRHTFRFFGSLAFVGFCLNVLRWIGIL